jgi:hypothetical protein
MWLADSRESQETHTRLSPCFFIRAIVIFSLERFSVDVNRNNKGVPRGEQIRFELQ